MAEDVDFQTDGIIKRMAETVELVILGGGPAGLAAAVGALDAGVSYAVVESGVSALARDRGRPADLVSGVGGAGLYSDGKFSFAPSATELWNLEPIDALREAYEWTAALLRDHGLDAPPFQSKDLQGNWIGPVKAYPSLYMPLGARMEMIGSLERRIADHLVTGADGRLALARGDVVVDYAGGRYRGQAAVIASGRFGPLEISGIPMQFRRVEIGMRVEQDAARFALDAEPIAGLLDPKWIRRSTDGRYEWRTFCCCRRGEVVETRFGDLSTVSGRADGDETNRSNFGLNVRFLDADEAIVALAHAVQAARGAPMKVSGAELLDDSRSGPVARALGPDVASALAAGLIALGEDFDVELRDAVLHLPAVEGVGYYPSVDRTLRVSSAIWAAGDAVGLFRGLVPALVSGRLAATLASRSLGER